MAQEFDDDIHATKQPAVSGFRLPKNIHWWLLSIFLTFVGVMTIIAVMKQEAKEAELRALQKKEETKVTDNNRPRESTIDGIIGKQVEASAEPGQPGGQANPPVPTPVVGARGTVVAPVTGSLGPVPVNPTDQRILEEQARVQQQTIASAYQSPILKLRGSSDLAEKAKQTLPDPVSQLITSAQDRQRDAERRRDDVIRTATAASAGAGAGAPPAGNILRPTQAPVSSEQAWVDSQHAGAGAPASNRAVAASSKYTINQSTIIPAVMISAINSDMPGNISAMVTQNVYDSARGETLLIPKGSRLFGLYNSQVKIGQARVNMAFQRLIFPSGASVQLDGMQGADTSGRAGMDADVNNHFFKIFGSSFLIAGVQRLVDGPTTSSTNAYGGVTSTSGPFGQILVDSSRRILDRNTNIQPTLTVDKGEPFNIMVAKDLILDPAVTGVKQ